MSHLSLSDYALIGNQASAALVSRLGSIDWCCMPYLDSPSHFGALLDEDRGGRFQLMPLGDFRSDHHYLQRTMVLETFFETPHGRAVLTDWMPLSPTELPVIHRKLEVLDGKIHWLLTCAPRFGYGLRKGRAEAFRDGYLFRSPRDLAGGGSPGAGQFPEADDLACFQASIPTTPGEPSPIEIMRDGSALSARFWLEAGKEAYFTWAWGRPTPISDLVTPRPTIEAWHQWAHHCPGSSCIFAGPWHDAIARSALVLRVLQNSRLGAIAESVTTSLPGVAQAESPEGSARNWDFRFAWIRDLALSMQALYCLGHAEDARSLFLWAADILLRDGPEELQPVYRLDGGRDLDETDISSLRGYQGQGPVRVGNQSSRQVELDTFGHLVLAAWEYHRLFGEFPRGTWERIMDCTDYVCQAWRRPDRGPWEYRGRPEHFVASKAYCWAALDRACALAEALGHPIPSRWQEEKQILHRLICAQGFDLERNSFVRAFGDREIDASTLDLCWLGILPIQDPRIQSTLSAIRERLAEGVLLRRSPSFGNHGASYLSTSLKWIICLALSGDLREATSHLAEICSYVSDSGLLAEQIHPATGELRGNLPCASVHLALVNASLYVAAAAGRELPLSGLIGMPAQRQTAMRKTA